VEIKKLGSTDINQFKELIRVFEDVFEMKGLSMPGDNYLQNLLDTDSFFVFIALMDNKVVGGLTAYILQQYYSSSPLVYIYDLAVRTELQRQGIGKKLIAAIINYCKERGMEEVFVQADEEDGYALDFYRSTGGNAENVVHFTYPLKAQ